MLVIGENDSNDKSFIKLKFKEFLKEECDRCMVGDHDKNDPYIDKYFAQSKSFF
jgi:hypothetical protein